MSSINQLITNAVHSIYHQKYETADEFCAALLPRLFNSPPVEAVKPEMNLPTLNPGQVKTLKKVYSDANTEYTDNTKKAFLHFVNTLNPDIYNSKKLVEHMKAFLA